MARITVRYLVTRRRSSGALAYYWSPKASLRAAGFIVCRLPDDKSAAIALAEKLNAKIDAFYASSMQQSGPRPWTFAALDVAFQADHAFTGRSPRTQRDYLYAIRAALEWAGDIRAAGITRLAVMTWLRDQHSTRGAANTRNTAAALRRLLAFGRDQGWLTVNPAAETRLPMPVSRKRVWTKIERDAFHAAAIAAGRPSMALAVMLGWWIGQRPADLRTLSWSAYDGATIRLRQAKTDKYVAIPVAAELQAELEGAGRKAVQVVVSEATRRPYQESAFQHTFAAIRERAGLPADLQFRDLRRTLATRLGEAGCTDDQIRAITGHKTRNVVAIYVQPNEAYGQAAMKRLESANSDQSRTRVEHAVERIIEK